MFLIDLTSNCKWIRKNLFKTTFASYFENIERIAEKDYIPTNQDILHTRVPTTGVVKLLFTLNGIDFNIFDVGGQRSERRKWIHIFDDVNAIIFVVAISEYDQKIREDNSTEINENVSIVELLSAKIGIDTIKKHYLCRPCHDYKIYNGKMRPEGNFYQTRMRITKDRKCFTCGATKTSKWYRHSKPEQYTCHACYTNQIRGVNIT
uniref:Uncharacterized protein n=1 Tax=Meloidogyne enterolobii TaxID=390850 RepID=A0A6V7UNK1_MELEN|nr:unnamed protein product [Meloidogyne enterolobii]